MTEPATDHRRRRTLGLRTRFLLYLVAVHLVFAGAAGVFLWNHRPWLIAVELFFVASFAVAVRLLRATFEPLELLRGGAQMLRDSDFTTRFRERGVPELDDLADVYNQMADRLRDERTRQQEQEAFLERVLSASPAGVLVLDFDQRVASANPAARRMLGAVAAPSERAGDGLRGRLLEELGGAFARELAAIGDGEARVLTLLGSRRVKCQRAHFLDRGFPRPFLVLEELTDELRRSEKAAYDKLIRMMSHEVNNTTAAVGSLLSACLNYTDQVRAEDRGDFAAALEVAIARTRSLSAFVGGFADVVRLPPPRRQPADLADVLRGVVGVLREEALRRRIVWQWEVTEAPVVLIDRAQLEQALLNILKNALEATGEDGTVELRVSVDHGRAVLAVRDGGSGIPEAAREQLFTPFFTTKENGQGIGLTLVREILMAHGLQFSLENAPGGGAEFVVRF